ncbi:MAG: NUDIX hydrolase [Candidatus Eremiobacteraeota bacterium]|nr:NUDIX hydrolase [Candidatus Eremiobacteraeota bacterium]
MGNAAEEGAGAAPVVESSEERYRGPVFRVRTDMLRYADGHRFACDVVEHPGSVAIAAMLGDRELLLVRQYRHPFRATMWEIPAGKCEPGESPLEGALRELAEETGYRAARVELLATVAMTPGFCDEVMHLVLARDLTPGAQSLDDDERIEARAVPLDDAMAMFERGEIADAKTLLALLWMKTL